MKARPLLLLLTASAHLASAQTETEATARTELDAIIAPYAEAHAKFMEKFRALPREEKREFYLTQRPSPEETRLALKKFITDTPQGPNVIEAYSWIAQNIRKDGLDADDYTQLQEKHLNHEKLPDILITLASSKDPAAQALVKTASEKSTIKNNRGAALYALSIGMRKDQSKIAEYDALIEKLITDHPDLTINGRKITQGMKAKRDAAINLVIGKPAPEIIGKDVDGNEMKLSDYKGKVVVLDFWGDW